MAEAVARESIEVSHSTDLIAARGAARALAAAIGFDETAREEVALAVSELASNLVKHARGGRLTLTPLARDGRGGIQIETVDSGAGIADVHQALADGFSAAGSLGYGLGAVNRLMDELDITSHQGPGTGTRIVCRRWLRERTGSATICPLAFGAATRPHPHMIENGDAFVIKRWGEHALLGVIDGLGHGQFARRAAETARQYVESHYDQPMEGIFRGVERACRATRGVVMALARFNWGRARLVFASVGNVEARAWGNSEPMNFILRRGIIGANAPLPVVTEHPWDPRYVLVLHSDGLRTRWRWEDFPHLAVASATVAAQQLLRSLAKDDDDATVVVVKGRDDSP